MKRFFALASLLVLTAGLSFAGQWTGYVTDLKCANAGKAGAGHAGCAANCIKGGAAATLVVDGKIFAISNQEKITSHAGEKVTVTGSEADGKITVESVSAAD